MYLVMKDLRDAIEQLADFNSESVLDFGCGGSPYRSLFRGHYDRADIAANPDRDITLQSGSSLLPERLPEYDLVLSTQVLEHVENPAQYLTECRRALRSEGSLVLTTHGLFEDHPCPHDYWRWTAEGLAAQLKMAGLVVEKSLKITVGPRASLYFLERELNRFGRIRDVRNVYPTLFGLVRRLGRPRLHRFADRQFSSYGVVDAPDGIANDKYICVGVCARKG